MNISNKGPKLACQILDMASLYSETYLNRGRQAGKRPKRIRLVKWRREQQRPGPCLTVDCRNLDIDLSKY